MKKNKYDYLKILLSVALIGLFCLSIYQFIGENNIHFWQTLFIFASIIPVVLFAVIQISLLAKTEKTKRLLIHFSNSKTIPFILTIVYGLTGAAGIEAIYFGFTENHFSTVFILTIMYVIIMNNEIEGDLLMVGIQKNIENLTSSPP